MSFHFDKSNAFCISLLSKPERWARMEARFAHFGLECNRWIATTPDLVTDTFYDYLNGGQRACGQSHINVWRHIIANDLPYALVLEDDAMFDKDWMSKLPFENGTFSYCDEVATDRVDGDWDLFLLNASEPITPQGHWLTVQEQYLTGGYIISRAGAEHLLNSFAGCYASSDWMTSRLQCRGRSYSYFPWLVIQEGTESTIGSGYEADHAKVIRCLGEANYDIGNYV
jgi:GR25 family glycosyltransferase involved in LPS biosynthesis